MSKDDFINFVLYLKWCWKVLVLLGVPIVLLPLALSDNKVLQCTFVLCLIASYWITEVMNLAVTSLIPIVLFPAFGILTPHEVAKSYMKEITVMLIGGLIVAKAIEDQNLHTRLALRILMYMGPNPIFQYLGFMISTWFLSMWISNTATTAMMVTLGTAVVNQWELMLKRRLSCIKDKTVEEDLMKAGEFSKGLYLSIAYAAACGGIATLIGTGPNLIFYGLIEERYGSKIGLNFGTYLAFALPLSVILLFITWGLICIRYVGLKNNFLKKKSGRKDDEKMNIIKNVYASLGPIRYGEISALIMFGVLVLLWTLREPGVPIIGRIFIHKDKSGKDFKFWSDSTSAILVSFIVFVLPSKNPFKRSNKKGKIPKLLDWKKMESCFPWELVFLFGGGFALADGCLKSGLSDVIGKVLTKLQGLPEFAIIFFVTLGISFVTEITSNSATATIIIPLMMKMAECIKMHPLKISLASAIACSLSFCLPAATPPNAIVFSTGRIRVIDMASSGLPINFICVLILTIACTYYSISIFGTNDFPAWIPTNCSGV